MLANAVLLLLLKGRVWSLVPRARSAEGLETEGLESETSVVLGAGLHCLL